MKKAYQIIYTLFIPLLIISCGGKYEGKSEGEIHFKVSYPNIEKDNFMLESLPKKMITKFKAEKISNSLSAGMGMFKFGMISDYDDQHLIRTAKLFNKKYALSLENEFVFDALKQETEYEIEHTDETKTILGLVCKKIIITVKDSSNETFTAFYTDQIDIEHSNWFSQYASIDGVLLEYQYDKYGIRMHFTATKVHFKEIDDEDFEIPENYVDVSIEKMDKEMNELFGSFQ